MIRFLLVLWLFCTSYLSAHPQDPIDSLKNALKSPLPDIQKVKILNQLSFRLSGNNPDLGLAYAQQALYLANKINYERGISKSYNSLGVVMRVKGDYPKSLQYFFQALQIDEKLQDDRETARTLSGIGAVYVKLRNYDKGIEFFRKSLALRQKLQDEVGIAVCYTNLGDIYQKKGDYQLAIDYHEKSLNIERRISPKDIHYSLHSLGNIYYDMGNTPKSLEAYQEALIIRRSLRNKFVISETMINLARVLIKEGKFDEAYGYLDEGLALAKNSQAKELEQKAYLFFAELYEGKKDLAKSLYFYKKYTKMNDSLYNSEMTRQIGLLYNKYQEEKMEKQSRENAWLKKNQEIQEKYTNRQRKINILATISGVISLSLAVFLFVTLYQNQKAKQLLEERKEEIEKQNKQLSFQHQQIVDTQQQLEEMNEELQVFNHQLEEMVKERTEKIQMTTEALQIAKEELELFMYRVSHDFRGPLATLTGLAMLGRTETNDETAHLFFNKTELTAQKMSKMLDKLTMVNLISNKEVEQKNINFDEFIREVTNKISSEKAPINATISFQDTPFCTDPDLLRIILFNLLENAFQFQKITPYEHQVNVCLEKQEGFFKITVEDNGMGIPKEYQQKMFDMFFRASENSQGNGLGLYIVKKAVEKLQGEIVVESEIGSFTRFMILLPSCSESV
ncbi:MAG: hypothetical protein OHK0045_13400 [Raineya sp.]